MNRRKFIILAILSWFVLPVLCSMGATIYDRPTSYWWTGNPSADTAWNWAKSIDAMVMGNIGRGSVFYVDSNVANEGDGTSMANAKDTLNEAVALCTANKGDVIYIAQGHAETLSGSTDAIDLDIAGITVIGLGNGDDAPEFTFDTTTDEFVIGKANITVINCRFLAGVSNITMGISVEGTGDYFTLLDCVFPLPTTNTFEFDDAIDVASGATYLSVVGCEYYNDDAGADDANHFIDLGNAALVGVRIQNNILRGDFEVSAIWSNDADTEVYIVGNTITNLISAQHCIEFTGNATGVCAYNRMYTDAEGTTLDPGYLKCYENYVTTAVDKSGMIIPVHDTGTTQLNASSVTAIATAVDALTGVGMIGLCETNTTNTVVIATVLAGYGEDVFNEGWSLMCIFDTGGAVGTLPSGEIRDVTNYTNAGTFTTAAWSSYLTAGDYVLLFPTHLLPKDYGKTIYCDDGGSGGEATNWQNAVTTLFAAEALCSAGDTIVVGENHAEDLTQVAQIDFNDAGVTVIGMGEGNARPTLTFDGNTTSVVTISAAGVTLRNLRLLPSVTALAVGIQIAAAGHGAVLDNIAFLDGETATVDEWVDAIAVHASATDLMVKNCTYHNTGTDGHTNTFLDLTATTVTNVTIKDCTINGYFAEGAVYWAAAVPPNLRVENNTITNGTTTVGCIVGTGAATGFCIDNRLYCDTWGSALDPGSLICFENYASNAINTSAHLVPIINDELAEVGTGRIFYVDASTPGAGDGRTWATAVATLDAAVNLCENDDDRGDFIYIAAGHTETVASDFADIDVGGLTIIGLGNGKLRPYFDYTTGTGSSMLIENDDITIKNLWFHANIDSLGAAIEVKANSTNVTIEDCLFTCQTATDEFDLCIDHAAGNHGFVVKNCDFQMGAANAVAAIHFIDADYAEIIGNTAAGDYSTAVIHNETTAADHITIRDNILFNGTIGGGENAQPGIELLGTTSGMIIGNDIVCLLTTPELAIVAAHCYLADNHYNSVEAGTGRDIGLEIGKVYVTKKLSSTGANSDDLWLVAGGAIEIISMFGQVTTIIASAPGNVSLNINATAGSDYDADFCIVVALADGSLGDVITFGAITNSENAAILTANENASFPISWFCPAGMIEQTLSSDGTGVVTWYMTFRPLDEGVTVTPQ